MAFSGTYLQHEIVHSKLHFICHTWKVYLSPWNSELRVNLFDSPSHILSTYHWFIDAKRHWKYNAVILMTSYFVEHNAVKIVFFQSNREFFSCWVTTRLQISSALTLDSKHKALQLTCKRKFICVSLNVLFSYQITHVREEIITERKNRTDTRGLPGFVETENTEMRNIITVACIHFIGWF